MKRKPQTAAGLLPLRRGRILCAVLAMLMLLSACSLRAGNTAPRDEAASPSDRSRYLVAVIDEPDTLDFQRTTVHYTVALNSFNRLVETRVQQDGQVAIVPSLAKSWEVSSDGLSYTFHLRDGLRFSNGSALTAEDVLYTIRRMLMSPESRNRDLFLNILGAEALVKGENSYLRGFYAFSDLDFVLELETPFAGFLACLSMPGASILDRQTTEEAGDRFGMDPAWTVGTGSFILTEWEPGHGLLFTANPDCWEGAPKLAGLDLRFLTDAEAQRVMFERGELDILDLDRIGGLAEYYVHGDIYQDRLVYAPHIAISYIALNADAKPLDDVRVRKALQLSLDRELLLNAVYSGMGTVENGIFPHGLKGFNEELPEIPCDPEGARELLRQAGYTNGFALSINVSANATAQEQELLRLAAAMWSKLGVRVRTIVLPEDSFLEQRRAGSLVCYTATWSADYDDPDNFIYPFFGSRENTRSRSLCYGRDSLIERVVHARSILNDQARMREYAALEKIIIQDDAAWIPLFSRTRCYVLSERMDSFLVSWNGWYETSFKDMSLKEG